jgi:hypothetical protein
MTEEDEQSKHTSEALMFEQAQNENNSYRFELYVSVYGSRRGIGKVEHESCLVVFQNKILTRH